MVPSTQAPLDCAESKSACWSRAPSSTPLSAKKSGEKGEPGGSVAKLMGKITTKNILKQMAKNKERGLGAGGYYYDGSVNPPANTVYTKPNAPYSPAPSASLSTTTTDAFYKQWMTPGTLQATPVSSQALPGVTRGRIDGFLPPPPPPPVNERLETAQFSNANQRWNSDDRGLGTTHPLTLRRLCQAPLTDAVSTVQVAPSVDAVNAPRWTDVDVLVHLIDGFEIEEAASPFPVAKGECDDAVSLFRQSHEDGVVADKLEAASPDEPEVASPGKTAPENAEQPASAVVATIKQEPSEEATERPTETLTTTTTTTISETPKNKLKRPEDLDENDDDSISIGSKEGLSREEMMSVDYESSPPSHSPVSFPLRDISSTDSLPSHIHELPDEKPDILLCEPSDKYVGAWNEQDVYNFIGGIEGCSQYAEEFISQEIDGQALILLNEDHLMSNLNVKLGPALKILAKIREKM